ncbi:MAG: hypothetical protein CVT93_06300 [Bacteroidetes bacterium HGW-Bacteroidetes-10]|jgi:DNA repair exonuclease SbcCD ATPase subunit|nr:MAG: hypothetical protein CVT93_06300 [Bacteroidetes bacterium HGW-Bacteroidetes-10]
MKKIIIFSLLAIAALSLSSCVENSAKYKALQAQLDSLGSAHSVKSAEFEEVFATLNEVENGLKSIREAENILVLQSQKGGAEIPENSREQLKSDVAAIGEAIQSYKQQINKLKNDGRIQSSQFKKRLAALTAELEAKSELIEDLGRQLEEKDRQLVVKSQQIETLDKTVTNLRDEVTTLAQATASQQETIANQEAQINSGYYIIGTKSELITANVMSKGGLFKSAKISYQAEQSAFIKIDIREVKEIQINADRAKVLSVHPTGTYTLEPGANGMQVLKISQPATFWEQTKYLVIQTL